MDRLEDLMEGQTVDRLEGLMADLMAVPWEAPMVDRLEDLMEGQTVDRLEGQMAVR